MAFLFRSKFTDDPVLLAGEPNTFPVREGLKDRLQELLHVFALLFYRGFRAFQDDEFKLAAILPPSSLEFRGRLMMDADPVLAEMLGWCAERLVYGEEVKGLPPPGEGRKVWVTKLLDISKEFREEKAARFAHSVKAMNKKLCMAVRSLVEKDEFIPDVN